MEKIFQDAKDKYVTAVVLYADGSKKLFVDAAGSIAASAEVALDAFLKGVLVIKSGTAYMRATKIDGNTVSVGAVDYTIPSDVGQGGSEDIED